MKKFLLICLGNWGDEFTYTRHNFGFLFADFISARTGTRFKNLDFGAYLKLGQAEEFMYETFVFKGKTYMNLSGETAEKFINYFSLEGAEIIIAHDDVDISFGRVKIVWDGGAGGHKGVLSVIERLGKNNIRIRLGISRPKDKSDVTNFVLGRFSDYEMQNLKKILDLSFSGLKMIVNESLAKSMSVVNSIEIT